MFCEARRASRLLAGATLFAVALAASSGCENAPRPERVDLENRKPLAARAEAGGEDALRVAVGGMITPREGFAYYRRFLDYIGDRLDRHVELVDREDYAEINTLVRTGQVDLAFVCGGPYVDGHGEFGMELLVAPQAYGGTVYYSYFIVPNDGPDQDLDDLRGKTFAFTDPLSNTGALVPTYILARRGETPDVFFAKTMFTQSHDASIRAVAEGLVDGAAVDSLIWEYVSRTNPDLAAKTRVIFKSDPYGIPPVVVPKELDPALREELRRVFLQAHEEPSGREILTGMMIDRFVPIEDAAYDSIRGMKEWVAGTRR